MSLLRLAAVAILLLAAPEAFAHTPAGSLAGGFLAGLAHAFGGLDHVLALAALGLWAAWLVGRAAWARPVALAATAVLAGFAAVHGLEGASPVFVIGMLAASALLIGLGFAASHAAEKLGQARAQPLARAGAVVLIGFGIALLVL